MSRVRVDGNKLRRALDRQLLANAAQTAEWMAERQREYTRSDRIHRRGIAFESGRDARGIYARAGVRSTKGNREPWFFWYFEEFNTGRGGGWPFLRPSLFNHTREVARMMLGTRNRFLDGQ